MPFDITGLPAPPDARGWAFTEGYSSEPELARHARERSSEIGARAITPATGAMLKMLARAIAAKHVVEVGTNTGGAALWLLEGLAPDGQLTSLDTDGEHHRIARDLLSQAGYSQAQARLITGKPLDVITRLTDHGYDMVVLQVDSPDLSALVEQAIRLLRLGGLIVVLDAFGGGRVPDPAQRDSASVTRRLAVQQLSTDERLTTSLIPVGDGVLAAVVDRKQLQTAAE